MPITGRGGRGAVTNYEVCLNILKSIALELGGWGVGGGGETASEAYDNSNYCIFCTFYKVTL